jgi:hypothetical protein
LNGLETSPTIESKLLEKLAHPLRQKILILVEKEGYIGYKLLKQEINVATGTLYHHLKVLKGLIKQNNQKQYILTPEGEKALNYLFQDLNSNTSLHSQVPNRSQQTKIALINEESLSIYQLFQQDAVFYQVIIGLYLILATVVVMLAPKIVYLSFVPIEFTDNWQGSGFVPVLWLGFTGSLLIIISFISKKKLTLASWGVLLFYHSCIAVSIIIVHLIVNSQSSIILGFFSICLQALFLFAWTIILIAEVWSWERSLLSAVVINYLILIIPF